LLLKAGEAVKGDREDIKISDIESLKGLKAVRELYRVLIGSLITNSSKERSDEGLKTADI
jgi:hypothetical protein